MQKFVGFHPEDKNAALLNIYTQITVINNNAGINRSNHRNCLFLFPEERSAAGINSSNG